ncbi:MAG TPA: N-acetyltransferase [Methanothrix sp.]|jgi:ribosomal-protein-alanine N-acetyltransferase|uniref:GNAT family N-acetyltransferase n=1 Tax=Methanothrix sp. TaxID=90426 RepID=UPI002CAF8A99|nr:N-acetyltransferase [Methanothrix sp.]MDI9416238.1 N-acetyltransferase [Euryarchaeota archaeon]HON36791.1 N-acetyltransferase [Methanothrix sp.]HRU76166.1 N-acetyltransferase [Methanothrix sp.]
MRIRRAEPRDLPQMLQIESLCFPEETAFPPGVFAYLIRYAVAIVACEPEDQILGFIIGYTSGSAGAVYTLDVHTGYRRRGIGIKLLLAMEKRLARMGANAVRLEAALEKPGALELYRKAGYREREIIRNYYGQGCHAVRMWKSLPPLEQGSQN